MNGEKDVGTIERAFQLARSGACHSVEQIRTQLNAERHDRIHEHLGGASIQRQLKALLIDRGVRVQAAGDEDVAVAGEAMAHVLSKLGAGSPNV